MLVTRPAHQADDFCALVESAGGRPLRLPLIGIEWIDPGPPPREAPDFAVFTSANAVAGLERAWGRLEPALGNARCVAIGPATARRLREAGVAVHLTPPARFTSESLLEMLNARALRGRRIWIVKGIGGRRHLEASLHSAGSRVRLVPVYRRVRLHEFPPQALEELRAGRVDAALVTSGEILDALDGLLREVAPQARGRILLVAGGKRVATRAREAGFSRVVEARDPSDVAMMEALVGRPA